MGNLFETPKMPEVPELPPPVEDIDVEGQRQGLKDRLKRRKGRRSTILSGMGAGAGSAGKKTVLG